MKKLLLFMLAIFMILTAAAFSSCSKEEDAALKTEEGSSASALDEIEDANFEGYEFTVLTRDDSDQYWAPIDVCATEITSEPINDAVYTRTQQVQDKFNIKIRQIMEEDYQTAATTAVLTNDDLYDAILMDMQRAGDLAVQNLLIDFGELDKVDLSKSYWDKGTLDQISIANKCYFALGDINMTDNNATWCVLFNKSLYEEYDLGNAYECVENGEWTIDKYFDNCKALVKDLNGDDVMDYESDQWGSVGQYECVVALMAGAGVRSVEKHKDDIPEFNLDSAKASEVFNKVFSYMDSSLEPDLMLKADDFDFPERWTEVNVNTFKEGRALYYMCPMTSAVMMRDMEDDYGILPVPKFSVEQEKYYSTLQPINATVYCIPKTNSNLDRTGLILEGMAAASTDTLKKAYYDVTLQRRTTRDEESQGMIDVILENRIVDLGYVYNWNGLRNSIQYIPQKASNTYASTVDSIRSQYITDMNKTVEQFKIN